MFDVIIPVYKTEPAHLREAIDSVLNQSYSDFKIYISDGTPEDHAWHSKKTLADYDDERITIVQQVGKGISDARNQAGKLGKNLYVATLDSDDTWFELKLEYYRDLIQSNPLLKMIWGEAEVAVQMTSVKGNEYNLKTFGGVLKDWNKTLLSHRAFRVLWSPLMTSTQIYSRKVLEEMNWWDENLFIGEDTDLNVKILEKYPEDCHQIEASVGTYRVHSEQTTKGGETHGLDSGLGVKHRPDTFERMIKHLKEKDSNVSEDYWIWLIKTMNDERKAGANEKLQCSMINERRNYV